MFLLAAFFTALLVVPASAKQPVPSEGCTVDKKVTTCITTSSYEIVWDTRVRAVGDTGVGSELDSAAASCPVILASEDGYVLPAQWYTVVLYASVPLQRTVVTDKKGIVLSNDLVQLDPIVDESWDFAYCGEPIPA